VSRKELDIEALKAFTELLDDDAVVVRSAALKALFRVARPGDPRLVPLIVSRIGRTLDEVRRLVLGFGVWGW
jgi:HEAT repeat protein